MKLMKNTKRFFILLSLGFSLYFSGCTSAGDKHTHDRSRSVKAILMDSLQKLDSLALKYNAKNTPESLKYAKQAGKVALVLNTPEATVKACNILGNAFAAVSIDSGFKYYKRALTVADSFKLDDKKGKILYNLGMLNRRAGNYITSLILIDSALKISFLAGDYTSMSNSLNQLGVFYYTTGDKVNARKLFDSAFTVAKRDMLYLQMGSALGNLAKFEPDVKKANSMNRRAISYLERGNGSDEPVANILVNIGYRSQNPDSALNYFNKAVNMVSAEFAPEIIMAAYNNMAYCYLAKGDPENAEKCIVEHALPVALKTQNIDWQSTIYDTYADVLTHRGNSTAAMNYKKKSLNAKETANKNLHFLAEMLDNRKQAL
jgi:tetratricopeptide (TPR) repeat protein